MAVACSERFLGGVSVRSGGPAKSHARPSRGFGKEQGWGHHPEAEERRELLVVRESRAAVCLDDVRESEGSRGWSL